MDTVSGHIGESSSYGYRSNRIPKGRYRTVSQEVIDAQDMFVSEIVVGTPFEFIQDGLVYTPSEGDVYEYLENNDVSIDLARSIKDSEFYRFMSMHPPATVELDYSLTPKEFVELWDWLGTEVIYSGLDSTRVGTLSFVEMVLSNELRYRLTIEEATLNEIALFAIASPEQYDLSRITVGEFAAALVTSPYIVMREPYDPTDIYAFNKVADTVSRFIEDSRGLTNDHSAVLWLNLMQRYNQNEMIFTAEDLSRTEVKFLELASRHQFSQVDAFYVGGISDLEVIDVALTHNLDIETAIAAVDGGNGKTLGLMAGVRR